MCNGFITFAMARARAPSLYFAPLQGSTAQTVLPDAKDLDLRSAVFWQRHQRLYSSDAILAVLKSLHAPWPVIGFLLQVFPRQLRDFGYAWVARYRRGINLGRSCRLPTVAEREQLLP